MQIRHQHLLSVRRTAFLFLVLRILMKPWQHKHCSTKAASIFGSLDLAHVHAANRRRFRNNHHQRTQYITGGEERKRLYFKIYIVSKICGTSVMKKLSTIFQHIETQ